MPAGDELRKLLQLMARLRAPDGCPWDREQTLRSLRPFILEEAYELVEAINGGETDSIREELGDLLLEVVFVNQIAVEEKLFGMDEVIRGIHDKLVRRHPHVFETERGSSADQALERWDEIKRAREGEERFGPRWRSPIARGARPGAEDFVARGQGRLRLEVRGRSQSEARRRVGGAPGSGSSRSQPQSRRSWATSFSPWSIRRHLDVDAEVALSARSRSSASGSAISRTRFERKDAL